MVTIRVRENGPLVVSDSTVEIVAADGALLSTDKVPIALCRCGHSKTKPFCDGTHQQKAFNPDTPSGT